MELLSDYTNLITPKTRLQRSIDAHYLKGNKREPLNMKLHTILVFFKISLQMEELIKGKYQYKDAEISICAQFVLFSYILYFSYVYFHIIFDLRCVIFVLLTVSFVLCCSIDPIPPMWSLKLYQSCSA